MSPALKHVVGRDRSASSTFTFESKEVDFHVNINQKFHHDTILY